MAFVPVCMFIYVFVLCVCVCLSFVSLYFPRLLILASSALFLLPLLLYLLSNLLGPSASVFICLLGRGGVEIPLNQLLNHGKVKTSTETQIKESVLDAVIIALGKATTPCKW